MDKDPKRFYRPYPREGDIGVLSAFLIFLSMVALLAVVATARGATLEFPTLPDGRGREIAGNGPTPTLVAAGASGSATPASASSPAAGASGSVTQTTVATPVAVVEMVQPTTTPAATPEPAREFVVGNTDGDGVWLRRTPRMADHLQAWPDGVRMQVIGPDVEAEGRSWRHVRDPRGNEGYIPEQWLIPIE